ncbi:Putative addiction module antidote protein [Thiomonas sp. CB2]|nr:Putative addiction module antidote protein [Thiomonas sp. CB2]VDY16794.1 Putative addiction module antidote protein [Thiomonas sp. CB2]
MERLATEISMKDRSHDEAMAELFKEDPAFAAEYLNQLLQDGEPSDLLVALRQMAQARGGVRAIAKQTELNANQLYRTLSAQGNPELRSLSAVLKTMGLRLAVQPIKSNHAHH